MPRPNPQLAKLARDAEHMAGRDEFVCLDRNERVEPFPDDHLKGILERVSGATLCAYPDPSPLEARLSERLGVPAERILVTAGSDAAIRKLCQTYLGDGRRLLRLEPTYAMYEIYATMFGAPHEAVAVRPDLGLDLDALLGRVVPGVGLVALASPNQPTGTTLDAGDRAQLLAAAEAADALVLLDEAYHPFHSDSGLPDVAGSAHLAVVRSFSKAGGLAGLRLGYLVAQEPVVEALGRVRGAHDVNAMAIAAGCYVLDHPELVRDHVERVEAGRGVLLEAAAGLGLEAPPCPTNFQLLRLASGDTETLVEALRARGYLVKGGFQSQGLRRCIRVTLAGPEIMTAFVAALRDALAEAA